MSPRSRLFTMALLALVSVCSFLVYHRQLSRSWGMNELQQVVVLTRDKAAGSVLTRDDLEVAAHPTRYARPDVVEAEHLGLLSGRVLVAEAREGQPLIWRDLRSDVVAAERRSERIAPGKRVVWLDDDLPRAAPGWVSRGDRVDLVWLHSIRGKPEAVTFLKQVEVISDGHPSQGGGQTTRRSSTEGIAVALLPREAEVLLLARSLGDVEITLRAPNDDGDPALSLDELNQLFAQAPPAPVRRLEPTIIDLLGRTR